MGSSSKYLNGRLELINLGGIHFLESLTWKTYIDKPCGIYCPHPLTIQWKIYVDKPWGNIGFFLETPQWKTYIYKH